VEGGGGVGEEDSLTGEERRGEQQGKPVAETGDVTTWGYKGKETALASVRFGRVLCSRALYTYPPKSFVICVQRM